MEARVGIEPTHKGFADLSLTTWVPRPEQEILRQRETTRQRDRAALQAHRPDPRHAGVGVFGCLERETGLEPATLALARRCSTTELLPHTS